MIEFLAEWLVSLLMPAQGILEVRAPHLSFMLQKDYWFREIYLGLKVTASFGRSESYTRVVDGQVRCITPDSTSQQLQVVWNVQYVTAFIPAWMVPPIFHSIQRDTLKNPKQPGNLDTEPSDRHGLKMTRHCMARNLPLPKTHHKKCMD